MEFQVSEKLSFFHGECDAVKLGPLALTRSPSQKNKGPIIKMRISPAGTMIYVEAYFELSNFFRVYGKLYARTDPGSFELTARAPLAPAGIPPIFYADFKITSIKGVMYKVDVLITRKSIEDAINNVIAKVKAVVKAALAAFRAMYKELNDLCQKIGSVVGLSCPSFPKIPSMLLQADDQMGVERMFKQIDAFWLRSHKFEVMMQQHSAEDQMDLEQMSIVHADISSVLDSHAQLYAVVIQAETQLAESLKDQDWLRPTDPRIPPAQMAQILAVEHPCELQENTEAMDGHLSSFDRSHAEFVAKQTEQESFEADQSKDEELVQWKVWSHRRRRISIPSPKKMWDKTKEVASDAAKQTAKQTVKVAGKIAKGVTYVAKNPMKSLKFVAKVVKDAVAKALGGMAWLYYKLRNEFMKVYQKIKTFLRIIADLAGAIFPDIIDFCYAFFSVKIELKDKSVGYALAELALRIKQRPQKLVVEINFADMVKTGE